MKGLPQFYSAPKIIHRLVEYSMLKIIQQHSIECWKLFNTLKSVKIFRKKKTKNI